MSTITLSGLGEAHGKYKLAEYFISGSFITISQWKDDTGELVRKGTHSAKRVDRLVPAHMIALIDVIED